MGKPPYREPFLGVLAAYCLPLLFLFTYRFLCRGYARLIQKKIIHAERTILSNITAYCLRFL